MINKIFYTILFIFVFAATSVRADTTATMTLVTYVVGNITFNVTGTTTTTIDTTSGALGTGLNINYSMATNNNQSNLRLHAVVLDSGSVKRNAFYPTGGTTTNQTMFLTLGNTSATPTTSAISNCQIASSAATLNANAIAYPGNIILSGGGTMTYNSSGYYTFNVRRNVTNNLNMSITTTPKAGTFDSTTALDEPGPYTVEIYIDNI